MTRTKTQQMMDELRTDLTCPVGNQYQGDATRMLFVCSAGLLRSPTGAAVATRLGFNARSCGSSVGMSLVPISVNLVHWAKHIFFMNSGNFDESLSHFFGDIETCGIIGARGIVLNIEDEFNFGDPKLEQIFHKILNDTRFN